MYHMPMKYVSKSSVIPMILEKGFRKMSLTYCMSLLKINENARGQKQCTPLIDRSIWHEFHNTKPQILASLAIKVYIDTDLLI